VQQSSQFIALKKTGFAKYPHQLIGSISISAFPYAIRKNLIDQKREQNMQKAILHATDSADRFSSHGRLSRGT
jgi:hypothetical protein